MKDKSGIQLESEIRIHSLHNSKLLLDIASIMYYTIII